MAEEPVPQTSQGGSHTTTHTQTNMGIKPVHIPASPKLPVHAILHEIRGVIEWRHRAELWKQSVRGFEPPRLSLSSVPTMRMLAMESCCNKTVPLYLWPDNSTSRDDYQLLLVALHNYLYRTWFVPYRSEIDWGQFVAQPIGLLPDPSLPSTDDAVSMGRTAAAMTRAITTRIKTSQAQIREGEPLYDDLSGRDRIHAIQAELGLGDWERIRSQKHLHVQPLFQAVAIVIQGTSYNLDVANIAHIPALLVITGVTDGLSAPVTADTIPHRAVILRHPPTADGLQVTETTLGTAIAFVMALEKRELAAVGATPDPAETGKEPRRSWLLSEGEALFIASKHGWKETEAPEGPSSSWVDPDIYKEWTGHGADFDRDVWERRCRKFVAIIASGGDPYL